METTQLPARNVMASTHLWRSWSATVEWDTDATVPPDIRRQLAAFVDHVWSALAEVAAAVADATDGDLIALLVDQALRLHGSAQDQTATAMAAVVRDRYVDTMDVDRIEAWTAAIARILEEKAPPVQWAIVAVLFERVLRAVLASGHPREDTDAIELAADALASSMRDVFRAVCTRAIPPQAYHVM